MTVACALPAVAVPMVGVPGVVTGVSACVTVTSTGLPVAPAAVTLMVAVRADVLVLAVKLQLIVPVSVPPASDVIVSQLPVTDVLHVMAPVPVLDTLNDVVPASFATA